jgi:hypothetical protein
VAEKDKIKIILVDTFPEEMAPSVSQYIRYDFADHSRYKLHAAKIIEIFQEQQICIDGCSTLTEGNVPLAALINDKMGLHGAGVEDTNNAKKKSKTHQIFTFLERIYMPVNV